MGNSWTDNEPERVLERLDREAMPTWAVKDWLRGLIHDRKKMKLMRDGLVDIAERCDGQYPSDVARTMADNVLRSVDRLDRPGQNSELLNVVPTDQLLYCDDGSPAIVRPGKEGVDPQLLVCRNPNCGKTAAEHRRHA